MATQRLPGYVEEGMLMPLNDLIDKYRDQYDLDDISDASYFGSTIDGNIYGIPSGGNTKHLIYRTDLFEQYNLEVPTTWDEIIDACGVLADEPSVDQVFTMNLHAGWAWELQFRNIARAYGMPALVNDDNTPAFNSPEGVAAGELMVRVIDACMGDLGLTYSIDDSEIGMENGSLAFVHIWASRGAVMHDPEKTDIADLLAFAPAAAAEEGGLLTAGSWSDYYGIPAMTTIDPEIAFQVIMEALDLESQEGASEFGLPSRASIEGGPDNTAAAAASVAGGVGSYGKNPAMSIAQASLGKFLPLLGTGEMTPQEALDAAAEDYITEATAQGYLP
jgi:multiple sugar transport system substrate-binding protein